MANGVAVTDTCQHSAKMQIRPCHLIFIHRYQHFFSVVAFGGSEPIREKDNCAGIATFQDLSGPAWGATVTKTTAKCVATFRYRNQWAKLTINDEH